jgi:hypothetical protein
LQETPVSDGLHGIPMYQENSSLHPAYSFTGRSRFGDEVRPQPQPYCSPRSASLESRSVG